MLVLDILKTSRLLECGEIFFAASWFNCAGYSVEACNADWTECGQADRFWIRQDPGSIAADEQRQTGCWGYCVDGTRKDDR